MNLKVLLVLLLLLAQASAQGVAAHHSTPVNFDQSREITIEGVLTEVVWRNPHSRVRVDVTGKDGSTAEWLAEMGGINTMRRAGFPTEPFVVGDRITITGNPGRRGRTIRLRSVVLQDGTRLNEDSEMSDLADDQERRNNAILVALALWFPSSIGLSGLNVGPTTLLNHDIAPDGSRFVAIFPGGVNDDGSSRDQIVTVQNWFEELRRLVPTN